MNKKQDGSTSVSSSSGVRIGGQDLQLKASIFGFFTEA